MQQNHCIGDERFEVIARRAIAVVNLFEGKRFGPERFQNFIIFPNREFKLSFESLGIDQIDYTQAGSRRFVSVGGTNAALGGSDFIFSFEDFALRIEFGMVRKNQVRGFTHE